LGSGSGIRTVVELEAALERALPRGPLPTAPSPSLLQAAAAWSDAVWNAAIEAGPLRLPQDDLQLGLALAARPVFLCGAHRSGTTMLQNLLDGHPALVVLPSEGSFSQAGVNDVGREWIRRLANPANQPPFFLLGRSSVEGSPYVHFARALAAWWPHAQSPLAAVALSYAVDRANAKRWVEKTPGNEQHLPRLWREFPAAKAIHIVRNPAAVYASRIRLDPAARSSWRHRSQVLGDLNATYRIASGLRDDRRYHLVKYEELIADTERVMAAVAKFLEIEWFEGLTRPTLAGLRALPNTSFMDRSEAMLTAEHSTLLDAYVGRSAERLGYARAAHTSRVGGLLRRLTNGIW
jgi:hypothetical protein